VTSNRAHRVVIVTFPGGQSLDVTGPAEVMSVATQLGANPPYRVDVVGPESGLLTLSNGMSVEVGGLGGVTGPIATLLGGGGVGVERLLEDQRSLGRIARLSARAERVVSVCTGAFVLAALGLLDGRRATTHWAASRQLARRYPAVDVDPEPIFIRDGRLWTSAGVTSGMDLTLALVAEDHGEKLARQGAQWLVLYLQRPGGQAQFSALAPAPRLGGRGLGGLRAWAAAHLDADLSVEALARRAAMSPRHFARRFAAETGTTPASHITGLRLERARQLLQGTSLDVRAIASACGFGTPETLHRSFRRHFGTTPGDYRARFAAPGAVPAPSVRRGHGNP